MARCPVVPTRRGRGRYYGKLRALSERVLRRAYLGDWPARAWGLLPYAREVRLLRYQMNVGVGAPLRIAFASDLHLGPTTSPHTLARAFAHLRACRPDVLVLGGDYVFLEATESRARALTLLASSVEAKVKVAVFGNHDLWTDHARIGRALGCAGVRMLENEAVRLPAPWSHVAILGLDEPWTGAPDGAASIAACGDATVRIAVSHAPTAWDHLRHRSVSLLLCGHTHGGQIALPGFRPPVLPPHSRHLAWGMHAFDRGHVFVSRGVGATELPVRAFAPPDVALFTLH
jgi:predicted MPP superfamily phosphohydrolase